jgi:hypothetical protein
MILSCCPKEIRAFELELQMGHEEDKRTHFKIAIISKRGDVYKGSLICTQDPVRTMYVTKDVQLWPDS